MRQAAADVGVELLVLGVHAVRTETLAQVDHRGRARGVEQLVDDHDLTRHATEAMPVLMGWEDEKR